MNRIHTALALPVQGRARTARLFAVVAACLLLPLAALAQVGVTTPAGAAGVTGTTDNADGTLARFNNPAGLASDGTSIYVADQTNGRIRKVNISTGAVTLFASGLQGPSGVAVDGSGNVYVAETGNHVIKVYSAGGSLTSTIGTANIGSTNSTLVLSSFSSPQGVAVNSAGTVIYVADTGNNLIRRINIGGNAVTSIVTTGLAKPWSIVLSGSTLYFTDHDNGQVKSVAESGGSVTTLSGTYSAPRGISIDGSGNLYVTQAGTHIVTKIAGGTPALLAGTSGSSGTADGLGTTVARFNGPFGVVATATDTLYVADYNNHTVRRVFPVTAPVINSANNTTFSLNSFGSFSVTATGTPAPTFAVQSGSLPSGVTLASGGLLSGTPTANGTFNVTFRATNLAGFNDQAFTLTVTGTAAPQILSNPVSTAVNAGQNAGFTASASGAPVPTVKWQRQASGTVGFFDLAEAFPYSGTTTGTLTITSATAGMNGDQFQLVATNVNGVATSTAATLSINNTVPAFTANPSNTTIIPGQNGSFSAAAIGSPTPTLRWQRQPNGFTGFFDLFDDATYGGTTTGTLTITAATVGLNGDQFRLSATNVNGTTYSNPAVLGVTATLPVISLQPTAAIVNLGANATFSSGATGNPTPTLRWQRQPSGTSGFVDLFEDATYTGTTSATLTVVAATSGMSGDLFRLVATNVGGSVQSTPAQLTVNLGTTISTFAGVGTQGGSLDGTGASARFSSPSSICIDSSGNFYIADTGSHVIRKMTAGGVVTTIAGLAGVPGAVDGAANIARFNAPSGIAVDGAGNLYIADSFNHTIRTLSPSGIVGTLAGTAGLFAGVDGVGSAARFYLPTGIVVDAVGTLYVADSFNHAIRRITSGGTVSTFVGALNNPGFINGVGVNSRFNSPNSLAIDSGNNLIIADSGNNAIRRATSSGVVTIVAGSALGLSGTADGNGTAAFFSRPSGVALDSAGNIFVADTLNNTVRRISTAGDVTTVAGAAGQAGYLDGVGSAVRFNRPFSIVLDANANLFIADSANHVIRRSGSTVAPSIVTQPTSRVVALGGSTSFTVVGAGTPAPSGYQWQRKPAGSTDFTNLTADLVYSGVTTATLTVTNVTQAMSGDQFRVVVVNGVSPAAVSDAATLAVGIAPAFTSAAAASFRALQANTFTVTTDSTTPVTFSAAGLPSWATLVATTGVLSGNPPDTTGSPFTVTITASNGIVVTQTFTLTILPPNLPPTIATQPAGLAVDPGANATFTVAATGTAPFTYQWRRNGADLVGATAATLTLTGVQAASSGVYSVRVANDFGAAVSNGAALVVNAAPVITLQPQPQLALSGGSATFTVAATGSGSLAYQWRRNGVAILGANSATLQIPAVSTADVGNYDVQINNSVGSAQSSTATLGLATAAAAPVFTLQPAGRTVLAGSAVTLYAAASGAPAPAYQWRKNGVAIPGALAAALSFTSAQAADAASYDVIATNSAGAAVSSAANLTVLARSFAGVYFGSFGGTPSIGNWALYVRDDNTGVFLSYLPAASAPVMSLNIVVGDGGAFSFSQAAIASVGAPGEPERAAALLPVTLVGSIGTNGAVTGTIAGGASSTLTGAVAPVTGGTLGLAGFYQAGSSANGAIAWTIAGPNGVAFAVAQAGSVIDGGVGTVTGSGAVIVTTGRSTISEVIAADSGLVTGSSTGLIVATALSGGSDVALARQRLVNISSRARVASGDSVAIAGFVISGQEAKPVLIRAVGPTLGAAPFNVPGALATPRLELFRGSASLAVNTGISANRAAIDAAGVQIGAFALGAAGADAAILTTLAPGAYTAVVSSTGTAAGVALIEVYDLSGASPGQKLLNISTRANAGLAENQLIAGFVVPGGTAKRVLVRGVGPGLAPFGLTGLLAQPVLTLNRSGVTAPVATNTGWNSSADSAAIRDASASVGAFALAAADSAVIVTLPPGNYTAQVTGVNNTTGVALIEVYELP